MSTPWLRAVCWANLLWVRMIPRHLCIIGQIFCLFCVKAMFVCFYKYPWILQHTSSQALSWPLSLFKQPDSPKKNFSSNGRFSKKLLLEPKKFYQKPLPPPASLTQWVASRNWVSTARPTQPALLVGAPCTSQILPQVSLVDLSVIRHFLRQKITTRHLSPKRTVKGRVFVSR